MSNLEKLFIKLNPTIAWEEKSDFTYFTVYRQYIFRYAPVKRQLTIQSNPGRIAIIDVKDNKEFAETVRHGMLNDRCSIYAILGDTERHNEITYEFKTLLKDLMWV
jgi:hypothetical protein